MTFLILITEEKFNMLPPCMQDIIKKLNTENRIKHKERFQISLFLKYLGWDLEQQQKFWTPPGSEPIIGMENYEPPKCKTAIEFYHCSFKYFKNPIGECEKEFFKRFDRVLKWSSYSPVVWFAKAKED